MLILEEDTMLPPNVGNKLASDAASYPDRCWIVSLSILSYATYIDLSSYRHFFFYCSYTWAAQLIIGIFYLDISFICWFMVLRVCVFWSLYTSVDGAGGKGSGDARVVDVQTLLEAFFEHVGEICLFHCCN